MPPGEGVGPSWALEVSERYGAEVIYLGFVSPTDAFAFTHCVGGRCVRHLRYGWAEHERWWEVVEGDAEAWERAAFFEEAQLSDLDPDDPERAQVETLFRLGQVMAGTAWPILDARESARAAAVHFRLTGWLDDWAPGRTHPTRHALVTPTGAVISLERARVAPPTRPPESSAAAPPASESRSRRLDRCPDVDKQPERTGRRPWWRFR